MSYLIVSGLVGLVCGGFAYLLEERTLRQSIVIALSAAVGFLALLLAFAANGYEW